MSGSLRWGRLAAAWCLLFALLHAFWAVGGSWLLASSAGTALARDRPTWFVLTGLWGVTLALLAGAVVGLLLARRHATGRAAWYTALLGCLGGTFLLVRGIAVEIVLLTDAGGVAGNVGPQQTRASLVLWNPWFALGGLLFLAAGIQGRPARRGPGSPDAGARPRPRPRRRPS